MPTFPVLTSIEAQRDYFPGRLLYEGVGPAWKDLQVAVYQRDGGEQQIYVPAIAEPQLVWQITGDVECRERALHGEWSTRRSVAGDIFLTHSSEPYELRWRSSDDQPFLVMHLSLALPMLATAAAELWGAQCPPPALRELEISGDRWLSAVLQQLYQEVASQASPSRMLVQGLAAALSLHLVREYRDDSALPYSAEANCLPNSKIAELDFYMRQRLEDGVRIAELAELASMSESHFCRLFKATTGQAPLQYFIALRLARAQQLLRETELNVLEVALEVGYTNASHFSQVFRKELGQSPREYRQALGFPTWRLKTSA